MTTFRAKRVGYSHTIQLNETPDNVFPLFTPEGEKSWAAGWDFMPVFPDRETEENMIFTTTAQDHGQVDAIWIMARYKPAAYMIEYQRIEPGIKIGRIRIHCEADEQTAKTLATIEYVYTALSETGNTFVEGFTEHGYRQFIHTWSEAINFYLHTGKTLHS